VTYVWFDALTNYISFAGYDPTVSTFNLQPSSFLEKWPALQIIGKDILVPAHGIYWLIMLHAIGFPDEAMPQLLVHGWWNLSGAKISKSAGNVVDPFVLADKYGAEAVRYYLMAGIVTGQDTDFSEQRLIEYHDNWLANSVGNLLNRTLNMLQRYCDGRLPIDYEQARIREPKTLSFLDLDDQGTGSHGVYRFSMDESNPTDALANIEYVARQCNELIEKRSPWALAKDPARRNELDAILVLLAEAVRTIAMRLGPVLPNASARMLDQLDPAGAISREYNLTDVVFEHFSEGHIFGKPVPLFPRIETD
jgi:methionyl-tRNA synthetase